MSDASILQEALSDAKAYFAIGYTHNAIDVLFEGLDQCEADSAAAESIYSMLGSICCSFWASRKFDEGRAITAIVLNEALKRVGGTIEPEYIATYIAASVATGSTPFPIRRVFRHRNLIHIFGAVADRVAGDVVECGCAAGLSFLELCLTFSNHHLGWTGEGFHIFDSFEGLSEPGKQDLQFDRADANAAMVAANMEAGRYAFPLQIVSENVHRLFPRVELHPGWIPASFAGQLERIYRFVHIDVDLYQPTRDSLDYFFPRMADGGVIITDDYNWPGARKAFQEFCVEHGLDLRTTDTAQAFLVKGSGPKIGD